MSKPMRKAENRKLVENKIIQGKQTSENVTITGKKVKK